jgi:hypothetical protein
MAAMILRNSNAVYRMWPWTDFNEMPRYVIAMKLRHRQRLIKVRETVTAALGKARSRPSIDLLLAHATASARFRYSPAWQKEASSAEYAAQLVFEVFWLGLIQGCLRRPSPLFGAVLIEYLP